MDSYDSIPKVHPICENMIIGIAGSDRVGKAVVGAITPIFSLNHKLSVKEMIKHVQNTTTFLYDMFSQMHSDRDYDQLLLVVACIDHNEDKSYLYSLSSSSGFKPVEINGDCKVFGAKPQEVEEYIRTNMSRGSENADPIHLFSAAIRSIDDQMVSKDTISLILFKNKTAKLIRLDEQGNVKQ
ncbi:hypothetical protein [Peribacillus sp. V2I11]|uniref:hypothetical protein n=1 Tax=Peribacillus sp. V2I11 TaxID=3042277 RepID=UPI0027834954|nr:hypothetical protein [Peribacillus sp. V2I11]MDQ0884902.1 20S proteasome alpha/beta subunit [Peribacillus sp. V2I11]